jgi:hypothetical protein
MVSVLEGKLVFYKAEAEIEKNDKLGSTRELVNVLEHQCQ